MEYLYRNASKSVRVATILLHTNTKLVPPLPQQNMCIDEEIKGLKKFLFTTKVKNIVPIIKVNVLSNFTQIKNIAPNNMCCHGNQSVCYFRLLSSMFE